MLDCENAGAEVDEWLLLMAIEVPTAVEEHQSIFFSPCMCIAVHLVAGACRRDLAECRISDDELGDLMTCFAEVAKANRGIEEL